MTPARASSALRPLHGYAEVLRASGDDAFVRYELPSHYSDPAVAVGMRADGAAEAVAFVRTGTSRRTSLTAIGPPTGVDRLLRELRSTGLDRRFPRASVSLPQACADLLPWFLAAGSDPVPADRITGGDWDWMWTTTVPPVFPGEGHLVELDDEADADGIRALMARGNPRSHGHPGEGVTDRWLGLRDEAGRPVACAALHRNTAGHPHLSGITVAPELRGLGWGLALTAALTRQGIQGDGVCTLGMFSDNTVARRIYHGLGYQTAQVWASRTLTPI
ncbi:MAG TPA: GNAT family N-acetyltransferase [Segeticoccus sp.]|uniref:GNAT family N-acetyltransferase n=1 Tax=Segeticoccus sp. TaxID=2706531 RepID=UPI002D80903D|nr:GNAT family N-acetyltransferase [Segeticoccus sp.]HET8599543.1 GNAT family N-acetyltransferase [Segeticoccus sp.]